VRLETERRRKDSRRTPVSLTISPVLNEQGEAIGISVIARDLKVAHFVEAELVPREAMMTPEMDSLASAPSE
jgi:hypothetical protein